MNIIFISATCMREDYEALCKKRKYPLLDSSQKFFEMFLNGLAKQSDVTVDCITLRPISRGTYPGFFVPGFESKKENITHHYVPVWNFPVIKSLMVIVTIKSKLKRLLRQYKGKSVCIICDPLVLEGLLPTLQLGKKNNIMTVGFLTDLPDLADECDNHSKLKTALYKMYNSKINRSIGKLDKHIVLTEAMSRVAGKNPWMLLDCIVDENMLNGLEPRIHSDGLPRVLYAGKLHREFGLDVLAQAIPLVKHQCVFDIYGDGNYIDELKELERQYSNVHVHGIVPLRQVLQEELSASVLINPRTSEGEFTKYSFPSKTAEYMLAGVPVVMFRLPGISQSYEDYICFAKEETAESLAERVDEVLSMTEKQRFEIGQKAYEYVTQNKNNHFHAQRVINFLEMK